MKGNIGIIGGGLTGLTAAFRLVKKGYKVTVLEKGGDLGGLVGGFKINGTNLEKAYHHIFRTDTEIINLAEELGLQNRLKWNESSIGLYFDKKIYPFVTPTDLLRFQGLDIVSKIRLGLAGLYLQKTTNYKKFINVTAVDWMKRFCGERVYKVVWEPLLKGKFHDYYKNVSMAWLWARIHTRGGSKDPNGKEYLGYFDGGFDVITKALEKEIIKNKGKIILNANINKIVLQSRTNKIKVKINNKDVVFDKVIATVPSNVLSKLIDEKKYIDYINKLNSIDYLGAVIVIFTSKQSLSKYYWHNINDLKSPFLAFIQHTNLIDKENYKNKHIYYLGTYLPHDHKYFFHKDENIYKEFFDYLKNIFPDFDKKNITSTYIFKLKNAQHVVTTDYLSKIPDYKTPIKNLYLCNFSQIFPEDRGTNFAVREGEKIVYLVSSIKY